VHKTDPDQDRKYHKIDTFVEVLHLGDLKNAYFSKSKSIISLTRLSIAINLLTFFAVSPYSPPQLMDSGLTRAGLGSSEKPYNFAD
jgi:hypothetical protein